jgi:hypothetical protein
MYYPDDLLKHARQFSIWPWTHPFDSLSSLYFSKMSEECAENATPEKERNQAQQSKLCSSLSSLHNKL